MELYLVCEALLAGNAKVGKVFNECAAALESFDVLSLHVHCHDVDQKEVAQASRLLSIPDQVSGKELDTMVLWPRPHT